jgi:hypothetical protein
MLTPHSIIHGNAGFAYFNKIWGIPTAIRANDSSGGADSRVERSSYSSRDSHKDWGSTALVDILRWLGHFEQWQT